MVKAMAGRKMNSTYSNGLTADNSQPAETNTQSTNDLEFATATPNSKAESTLIACLALAGHSVHPLRKDGYLVSKWGYVLCAGDLDDLRAFAVRLGGCHG